MHSLFILYVSKLNYWMCCKTRRGNKYMQDFCYDVCVMWVYDVINYRG